MILEFIPVLVAASNGGINIERLTEKITMVLIFAIPAVSILIYKIVSKKLKHKQVMAAIEKGVLVPKTGRRKGARWIRSIYMGVLFLVISCLFLYIYLEPLIHGSKPNQMQILLFLTVTLSIGSALFVRGILLRKSQIKALALEKGVSFTDVYPPRPRQLRWIICIAIGLPLAGLGSFLLFMMIKMMVTGSFGGGVSAFVICTVPFVVGWAFLLSGLMLRKVMSEPPITETPAD